MSCIIDIETEPQERDAVERTFPDELRNPVMSEAVANPVEPNWQEDCPDYGLSKAKTEEAKKASEDKRGAWVASKKADWLNKTNAARDKWHSDIEAKRTKAFADAALDARTGRVRLIVLRDTFADEVIAFLWENDAERIKLILSEEAFYRAEEDGVKIKKAVDVRPFATEGAAIKDAFREIRKRMSAEEAVEGATALVGYYIKDFDLPFLFRRLWMNGTPQRAFWRRGRYWTDEVIDIHEEFAFGERFYGVGGLDGLAGSLGVAVTKLGDGASFGDWYARNPLEGLAYGVNDVAETEECARKMGVV